MPDTLTRARELLADGVYLDLPLADYLADPALSGSAFKKLLSDPAGLYWESDANPLWLKPDPARNRARLRGSAAHCAILEGLPAYQARYVVKPEGVLESVGSLKAWLRAERARRIAASIDGKLSKEDGNAVKQTGEREDLIARIHAINPNVPIWEPDGDTETLDPADDQYVRLLERFVRSDPDFGKLVSGGLAEVTIVLTVAGVRFKCRLDYWNDAGVLDVKTFGQAPRRGRALREHCVMEAAYNGYDLQAVHNRNMVVEAAARWCGEGNQLPIVHAPAQKVGYFRCADLLVAAHNGPRLFRWLFLRMGSGPTGISLPFRESDGQWQEAERQIAEAVDRYQQFRAAYGDALWLVTHGEQEIQDTDWPQAAIWGGA